MAKPEVYRCQTLPYANPDAIKAAAALLTGAAQPVIVAGGRIKNTGGHPAATELTGAELPDRNRPRAMATRSRSGIRRTRARWGRAAMPWRLGL